MNKWFYTYHGLLSIHNSIGLYTLWCYQTRYLFLNKNKKIDNQLCGIKTNANKSKCLKIIVDVRINLFEIWRQSYSNKYIVTHSVAAPPQLIISNFSMAVIKPKINTFIKLHYITSHHIYEIGRCHTAAATVSFFKIWTWSHRHAIHQHWLCFFW